MKIGFQGIYNCYSHQVLLKYLVPIVNSTGYKKFEDIFQDMNNNIIDFALVPIENSLGGCIFMNYELFFKYNIEIHCEFQHNIEHSLYSYGDLNKIKTIISHPQALQQCRENIKKYNFEAKDFWDTTGSIIELKKLNDITIGCIAPPGLGCDILKEHLKKFNDSNNNITRFYLVSIKSKNMNSSNVIKKNLKVVNNKFSGYIIAKNKIGILNQYLTYFTENSIDLTKIESIPYLGSDRNIFSYLFFIEGILQYNLEFEDFNLFGKFPILKMDNMLTITHTKKLSIGIIGFGRFGQFIGNEMVNYGFNVFATNITDNYEIANNMNIIFLKKNEFEKINYDIIIFASSILSFENVLKSYSKEFLLKSLIVDVLSVKEYPLQIFKDYLGTYENILLTHPMFGPDSAKNSWYKKNFVYYDMNITEHFKDTYNIFLQFWKDKGCNMIIMTPKEHDIKTANSQFLTHFIGRLLELCECTNTNVDTDGYKSLLKIKDHTMNDSWDLFYGLSKFNKKTIDMIDIIKYQLQNLENKLLYSDIIESETSKVFKKILDMNEKGCDIINCAIGIPTWYPDISLYSFSSNYSTAQGNMHLIKNLVKYYQNKYMVSVNTNNLMITCGAKPALYLTFKVLTQNATKWIIPKPYWTSYPDIVKIVGGNSIFIDTTIESNWEFDLTHVEEYFKNKLVNGLILCNPNNPTGLCYNSIFIEKIILLCKKYNKYLIVDEVYLPLTFTTTTSFSYAILNNFKKIVVISSFSKYWALPGWRVGWILSNEQLISNFIKLQSCIFTCAPTASMELANNLLNNSSDNINLDILDKSKIELEDLFLSYNWELIKNKERTMYIFPVNKNIDIDVFIENLLHNGIGVISGKAFGYNQAIRITLPNNLETLQKIKNIIISTLQ